jgi:hypothetical protein
LNISTTGPVIIGWASEEGFDNSAGEDEMVVEHNPNEPMNDNS